MRSAWKWFAATLMAGAIALAAIAPRVHAAPVAAQGQFTLPFEAHWGKVALQTGDYTFSVNHVTMNGEVTLYRGTQAMGIMRPETFEGSGQPGQNPELLCIRHDGKITIRALRLSSGTFYFALPTDLKVLVAQQPQLIETLPIQVSGE